MYIAAWAYISGGIGSSANSSTSCFLMNPVSTSPAMNAGFRQTFFMNSMLVAMPAIS